MAHIGVRECTAMGVGGAQPGLRGPIMLHFYHQHNLFACALKTIQFFAGNQILSEIWGRESLHKRGKKARRGQKSSTTPKVGSSVNTGTVLGAGHRGWPRRHTSYPNKLPFLVRKTDSNQLTGD